MSTEPTDLDQALVSSWHVAIDGIQTNHPETLRILVNKLAQANERLRIENQRLTKHWNSNRGELSGYTVGEVEFVEGKLRAAESALSGARCDALLQAADEFEAYTSSLIAGALPADPNVGQLFAADEGRQRNAAVSNWLRARAGGLDV